MKDAGYRARPRIYRGVVIWPKNVYGLYPARVDVSGGGMSLAADTLDGMKGLIRDALDPRTKNGG